MKLDNRVAIVTGGAGGIGRATCLQLAADGAKVAIADINLPGAEETMRLIEDGGGQGMVLDMDVTNYPLVEAAVGRVLDAYGKVDILANVAGTDHKAPVWELKEEHWDMIMNLNLKGTWHTCKAVLPSMIEREHGRIVNIASMAGVTGEA